MTGSTLAVAMKIQVPAARLLAAGEGLLALVA